MMRRVIRGGREATRWFEKLTWPYRVRGKQKIFCIGRNKTGTTSLKRAFLDLGYLVGDQKEAEILYHGHYFADEWEPIILYCHSAQVFQDVPFSVPGTFQILDRAFPGSKFILSVRDSPEEWYRSLTRFHTKKWGANGDLPTASQLRTARYRIPGFAYNVVRLYQTSDEGPYDPEVLMAHYERHNGTVTEYFADRPDDLLVINLKDPNAYGQFTTFLGVESPFDRFPWELRT